MKVLFLSENLHLGGLTLLELWRQRELLEVELASLWSSAAATRQPRLGASAHKLLAEATSVELPDDPMSDYGVFDGVLVTDYSQLANELDLKYHQVPNINASSIPLAIESQEIDLGVCIGYGKIFNSATLRAPKRGWLNFHPSMLPEERGPFPGFWEFRRAATRSGVSLHLMAEEADTGPIIAQREIELHDRMTFRSLLIAQAQTAASMVTKELHEYLQGKREPIAQDEVGGWASPRPQAKDFILDSEMTCDMVESFVRGMRGIAKPLVALDGHLYQIEGIASATPGDVNQAPGSARKLGHDRVEFSTRDGRTELLISPQAIAQ